MFCKVTHDFAVVNIRKAMQLLFVRQASISTLAFCLSLFALALFSKGASAQLTDNLSLGNPKALALGHAVTADPPGIDSIHYNPAGLAKIVAKWAFGNISLTILAVRPVSTRSSINSIPSPSPSTPFKIVSSPCSLASLPDES